MTYQVIQVKKGFKVVLIIVARRDKQYNRLVKLMEELRIDARIGLVRLLEARIVKIDRRAN